MSTIMGNVLHCLKRACWDSDDDDDDRHNDRRLQQQQQQQQLQQQQQQHGRGGQAIIGIGNGNFTAIMESYDPPQPVSMSRATLRRVAPLMAGAPASSAAAAGHDPNRRDEDDDDDDGGVNPDCRCQPHAAAATTAASSTSSAARGGAAAAASSPSGPSSLSSNSRRRHSQRQLRVNANGAARNEAHGLLWFWHQLTRREAYEELATQEDSNVAVQMMHEACQRQLGAATGGRSASLPIPSSPLRTACSYDSSREVPSIMMDEVVLPGSLLQQAMASRMSETIETCDWGEECIICLEGFSDSNPRMPTHCGCGENKTYFHLPCLYQWIEQSGDHQCPSCRQQLLWEEF